MSPERMGLIVALLSSALGGTAIVATRYLVSAIDPLTIGAVRFAGGFAVLFIVALLERERWPKGQDWVGVAALGLLFYGAFPLLFNAALIYTTAARAALALSTLPLLTMIAAALLGIERLTARKTIGVLIAVMGVATALFANLAAAPADAWRGDTLMLAAALCMAFYNVWSRPLIARSSPLSFATFGMGVGAACLLGLAMTTGRLSTLATLSTAQVIAVGYLAVVCGALIFFLWAYALARTTPTLVAVSVVINPITAAVLALPLLGEPLTATLMLGVVIVLSGIAVASGFSLRQRPRLQR